MNLVRRSIGAGRKSNSQSFSQAAEAVLFQCEEGERWGTYAVSWARAGYSGTLGVCKFAFKMYKVCLDTSNAETLGIFQGREPMLTEPCLSFLICLPGVAGVPDHRVQAFCIAGAVCWQIQAGENHCWCCQEHGTAGETWACFFLWRFLKAADGIRFLF